MKRTSDKKVFLVASIIGGAVAFFAWVSFMVHDLNAMHEAEKLVVQAGETWTGYISSLHETSLVENCSMIWHATARQRAEALLRTIGKWRDKTI